MNRLQHLMIMTIHLAGRHVGTRRVRSAARLHILVALSLFVVLVTGCGLVPMREDEIEPPAGGEPGLQRARELLGVSRSGESWLSGVWPGGDAINAARAEEFGTWRGAPTDAALTYPERDTWQHIHDSVWHIQSYDNFEGVLIYGLPMLPSNESGSFGSIVRGEHDWVYRKVAADLVAHDRGRSIVRIGWEANGDWFTWSATADQASDYVAAFRHIVGVLRQEAPELVIDFDINCGSKMPGQQNRLDGLTKLYPGDDVVDLVGCDTYDWYMIKSQDPDGWGRTQRPKDSVGIADVAEFARVHGKGLTYPEWGLASEEEDGLGDNPFFIEQMRGFFTANSDILVLEAYFNEPATSLANSIWDPVQMPRGSAAYRQLW